jgi:arylsulfatase A-like enzyme
MMFWWPGVKAHARFLPVETVDIAPTLAAALGLTPPADIDGRCLALAAERPC